MSVLGEPFLGYNDIRGTLYRDVYSYGSLGYGGLGHGSVLPLPLWRPTPTTLGTSTSVWCNSATCPCNVTPPYAEMLDYMLPSPLLSPSTTWSPWYHKLLIGDHTLKRCSPVDTRESPSKELPTKILKLDRLKERQDLIHSKRCTGTQTQISNVDRDLYMNGERHMIGHNNYSVQHAALLSQTSQMSLPRGSPPPYKPMDNHDVPLNLSLSNLSHSSGTSSSSFQLQQSSSHVPRPSVITCASSGDHRLPPYSANPSLIHIESREPHHVTSTGQGLPHSPNQRDVTPDEVCDPAIEEHFRRSLGRDYSDIMSHKTAVSPATAPSMVVATPSPPPPPPPQEPVAMTKNNGNPAVSITGSVDDHFAKSLGNSTWSAIKAKNDPIHDLFPGSVDDHFAKALGDTWLRIKAEKESGINTHSPNQNPSPSPQQRHDSSLLST